VLVVEIESQSRESRWGMQVDGAALLTHQGHHPARTQAAPAPSLLLMNGTFAG